MTRRGPWADDKRKLEKNANSYGYREANKKSKGATPFVCA